MGTPSNLPKLPDENRLVAECSIYELLAILKDRCPAMVWAGHVPDSGGYSDTVTLTTGNRCTGVGLADLLLDCARERNRGLQDAALDDDIVRHEDDDEDDDDDDDSSRT